MTLLMIGNQPLAYPWGSKHLIQEFANLGELDKPAAEVWFGTHPNSPAKVIETGQLLAEVAPQLGFLVKFLAAAAPLSIQAHPNKARAAEQFQAGNPSYTDANHKPEMIIAITDFEALCGFRSEEQISQDLQLLTAANSVFAPWLEAMRQGGVASGLEFAFANNLSAELAGSITALSRSRVQLFQKLSDHFPMDVGVMIGSVMLERYLLRAGEALYLPAGNIHAYLSGLGVEVMAASDNVLRGGLTQKPIDTKELMQVLDFGSSDPRVVANKLASGLSHYVANTDDFRVYRVDPSSSNMLMDLELKGSMIAVCVAGEIEISTSTDEYLKLSRGQAAFVADSRLFSITGSGTGYLAMG